MAERKRKLVEKKMPEFRVTKFQKETDEDDLKKVKEKTIKDLEEAKKNDQEWYDKELDKNMKKQ